MGGPSGGGSSQSTTQQTIAPELQGLFRQTGQQLEALQSFSPFQFQGQFPGFFPQAGGQPGGQPQVAQVPGLGTPTFAPAGLGTVTPTAGGLTNTEAQRLQFLQGIDRGSSFSLGGDLSAQDENELLALEARQSSGNIGAPGFGGVGTGGVSGFQPSSAQTGLPGTPLDEFLFPRPQQIPGFTPQQFDIFGRQQQRAFGPQTTPQEQQATGIAGRFGQLRGPERQALDLATGFGQLSASELNALGLSTGFGGLRGPELAGLFQVGQFTGGPIGSSPVTQAAIQAARGPVLNDLARAGLGNSGAVGTELAGAFAPILAQEVATRAGVIPQLFNLGQQLRGGDISAAGLQAQVGEAQRRGNIQAAQMFQRAGEAQRAGDQAQAAFLAQQAQTLVARESQLLGEAGATAEQQRTLQQQQQEAIFNDFLRRQGIGSQLTTGLLGGFPAGLGQGAVTTTEGGGASK